MNAFIHFAANRPSTLRMEPSLRDLPVQCMTSVSGKTTLSIEVQPHQIASSSKFIGRLWSQFKPRSALRANLVFPEILLNQLKIFSSLFLSPSCYVSIQKECGDERRKESLMSINRLGAEGAGPAVLHLR